MIEATKEILLENEKFYEKRRSEIRATKTDVKIKGITYYVSTSGDDNNDGKSPENPWKTLDKVSTADLKAGDGVLFKRGDLFRGNVKTKPNVTYSAYGEGEKPKLYGWIEDMADPSFWTEYDAENHIWEYTKKILDPGTLVFNNGEFHSRKHIPSFRNMQYVLRNDISTPFVMATHMDKELDIFWKYTDTFDTTPSKGEDFPIPEVADKLGTIYVKCSKGNPGEVFDSIEAIARSIAFDVGNNENVTVDNLCIKYYLFGVRGGEALCRGLHVTNCEMAWIGGNIMDFRGIDPNYPPGKRGSVTRFGNGVEIYGGCNDYVVTNCYFYQIYDAAITHQFNTDKKVTMTNIRYEDNLIEYCVYGIEWFLDQLDGESESYMENLEMSGNIVVLSGYGWGQQRHNTDTPALMKGWSYKNTARNFKIHNNIFDRCAYRMIHLVAYKEEYCPEMYENTYIQHFGGMIGQYGGNKIKEPEMLIFDEKAEEKIHNIVKDKNAKVYIIK